MKYELYSRWLWDKNVRSLSARFAKAFRSKFYRDAILKPRSQKLKPNAANLAAVIAPPCALPPTYFDWSSRCRGKSICGNAMVISGSVSLSYVKLKFSLPDSSSFQGSPFQNVDDLRDLALVCAAIGPAAYTMIAPDDRDPETSLNVLRRVDTWRVPGEIEWVTVLHRDLVANMDVDLARVERVAGARCGQVGDFWWIILSPEPFRYSNPADVRRRADAEKVIGLPGIHKRFLRRPSSGRNVARP